MLSIQKIKYKNFLSTGNQFTEVNFTDTKTTLIVGKNGEGKTTLHSALVFGLYGKSNRNTTKKQLVNSRNKKDCLVEVEFSNEGRKYKVQRGISPNAFQIWIDDVLQQELSAAKDQQKYLEQVILKMSYKTFMQVVVLGSSNFIPFMQLSASDRRDLVEELLDIKIFSSMNFILKDKIKNLERKNKEIEYNLKSVEDKIKMQESFIETIKDNKNDVISKYKNKIKELNNSITELTSLNEEYLKDLQAEQEKIDKINFSSKKLKQLFGIRDKLETKKSIFLDEKNFFENNEICPTCKTHLQVEFRDEKVIEIEKEIEKIQDGFNELQNTILEEEEKEQEIQKISSILSEITSKISSNNSSIKQINGQKNEIENEIDELVKSDKNEDKELQSLEKYIKTKNKLDSEKSKCSEAIQYFEFAHLLMKDGGVKTKIIEKYLPIINHQINRYLQMMDLYINFTLDEEFKEQINTPVHEDFSYGSFSEGEKQRISLSILFAWREIARIKNSVNCNLLFLDEIFDSSLDGEGTEYLLKIIKYAIQDSNIFIISHRIDELSDKFDRILEVKKVNGFSKVFS